jgi:carbonic anhydrase
MNDLLVSPGRLARPVLGAWMLVGLAALVTAAAEPGSDQALGRLKLGNDRFVKNASAPVSLGAPNRETVAKTHAPFAMVLSCADARVPPEYVFNAGLGDLFVVRASGQVADRSVMASLEHGVQRLHIPLLVVMGHESCDAVQAALESPEPEGANLQYLVKMIRAGTDRTAGDRKDLRTAILANVEQVINDAMAGSPVLRNAVEQRALQVVGAYYELGSGRVVFSEAVTVSRVCAHK